MDKLLKCAVCDNVYLWKFNHCGACGARRVFIASHSYQPYCITTEARNADNISVVRARGSKPFSFRSISY